VQPFPWTRLSVITCDIWRDQSASASHHCMVCILGADTSRPLNGRRCAAGLTRASGQRPGNDYAQIAETAPGHAAAVLYICDAARGSCRLASTSDRSRSLTLLGWLSSKPRPPPFSANPDPVLSPQAAHHQYLTQLSTSNSRRPVFQRLKAGSCT
jgi:hypothetical protein